MRFENSWSLPVVQGSARNAGNQEADRDPTPAVKDPKVVADPYVIREQTVEAVVQNTLRHVRICLRGSTSDELTARTHQGDLFSPRATVWHWCIQPSARSAGAGCRSGSLIFRKIDVTTTTVGKPITARSVELVRRVDAWSMKWASPFPAEHPQIWGFT